LFETLKSGVEKRSFMLCPYLGRSPSEILIYHPGYCLEVLHHHGSHPSTLQANKKTTISFYLTTTQAEVTTPFTRYCSVELCYM